MYEQTVGKKIVITGTGAGMGKALAERFARKGDTVILLGRIHSKVQAVADELGGEVMAVECDVASADSVRAVLTAIAEKHPTIYVPINNAAIE